MKTGNSDFVFMVKNNQYVDKTRIILDILPLIDSGSSIIVNRPRRFGKSLMISMLECFFSTEKEGDNLCFENLEIAKYDVKEHQNKYQVLRISFKDIPMMSDFDPLLYIKGIIGGLYQKYLPLFLSLKKGKEEEERYRRIISLKEEATIYVTSLKELTRYILEATGKKPIVLIDEYDAIVEKFYGEKGKEDALEFLKTLYGALLKDNPYLGFAFLTGVFSLAKGTLGSGLNNIPADNGITSFLSDNYFGFTKEEVKNLLTQNGIPLSELDKLERYYGGYIYYGKNYFNPWSVLSFLDTRIYTNFWGITARSDLFVALLDKEEENGGSIVKRILSGEDVFLPLDFSISYGDLFSNVNNIILYLFLAGYLSVEQVGLSTFKIKTVNEETTNAFNNEIIKKYRDSEGISALYQLKNAFEVGDEEKMAELLSRFFLSSLSYYDFADEKSYQIVVGVISAILFEDSVVKYEVIEGEGRCDIQISPKSPNRFGAIIEIKNCKGRLSKERFDNTAKVALRQIMRNFYQEELLQRGANPIYAFGFAFFKKKVAIAKAKIK